MAGRDFRSIKNYDDERFGVQISNLPKDTIDSDIHTILEGCRIRKTRLINNNMSGSFTGKAFVFFEDYNSVQKSLEMDGCEYDGQYLIIQPNKSRTSPKNPRSHQEEDRFKKMSSDNYGRPNYGRNQGYRERPLNKDFQRNCSSVDEPSFRRGTNFIDFEARKREREKAIRGEKTPNKDEGVDSDPKSDDN